MKYGKTYSVLLPSFPPSWQERAVHYAQLKKLINGVVSELAVLGLRPDILHELLHDENEPGTHSPDAEVPANIRSSSPSELEGTGSLLARTIEESTASGSGSTGSGAGSTGAGAGVGLAASAHPTRASYELSVEGSTIVPRLRLILVPDGVDAPHEPSSSDTASNSTLVIMASDSRYVSKPNTLFALQAAGLDQSESTTDLSTGSDDERPGSLLAAEPDVGTTDDRASLLVSSESDNGSLPGTTSEVIIPLNSDAAFYQVLADALQSLSEHQSQVQEDFTSSVLSLSSSISLVSGPTGPKRSKKKSDLYTWRQIFQLWVDAQIFESSTYEGKRTERSVEESERRLRGFAERVVKEGLGDGSARALRRRESKDALERFLQLNVLLLDLKKFHVANSEAIRKIMKKHEKRTALMFPHLESQPETHPLLSNLSLSLTSKSSSGLTLPHLLVVVLTERLLPVIPSIDDYLCLICLSLAYIPIRLQCTHIFCVRCLTKMQKRAQDACPICRAPGLLSANSHNVDDALKRFMLDWFPEELKDKDKSNRAEAAQEQAQELEYTEQSCCVM